LRFGCLERGARFLHQRPAMRSKDRTSNCIGFMPSNSSGGIDYALCKRIAI
jgi:hypothetical protein